MDNLSESDGFMKPTSGIFRDEYGENRTVSKENGIVRDGDAVCDECNVSYEDDARNGFGVLVRGGYTRIALTKLLFTLVVKNAFAHFVLQCI